MESPLAHEKEFEHDPKRQPSDMVSWKAAGIPCAMIHVHHLSIFSQIACTGRSKRNGSLPSLSMDKMIMIAGSPPAAWPRNQSVSKFHGSPRRHNTPSDRWIQLVRVVRVCQLTSTICTCQHHKHPQNTRQNMDTKNVMWAETSHTRRVSAMPVPVTGWCHLYYNLTLIPFASTPTASQLR